MKKRRIPLLIVCIILALVLLGIGIAYFTMRNVEFGFAREVSEEEAALRLQVIRTAERWLGSHEKDGSHQPIIDLYNAHEPLAQGYAVQYDDDWCAVFVSTVAIECGFTDIIPTECGCERQIGLFEQIGCWQEMDDYTPLPGDYIFYSLGNPSIDECTAWSDHVGIVVGTWNGYIKVIEGNNSSEVAYRYIAINDARIRGFALPDYASKASE